MSIIKHLLRRLRKAGYYEVAVFPSEIVAKYRRGMEPRIHNRPAAWHIVDTLGLSGGCFNGLHLSHQAQLNCRMVDAPIVFQLRSARTKR